MLFFYLAHTALVFYMTNHHTFSAQPTYDHNHNLTFLNAPPQMNFYVTCPGVKSATPRCDLNVTD